MAYTKTAWVDDTAPYIDADNLNKIEQGIADAQDTADQAAIDASAANSKIEAVYTVAASGTSLTLPDTTTATIMYVTLTANCTLTFPAAEAGKSFLLVLKQNATGSKTVTWPASVKWAGGTPVTLTTTANAVDYISFICADGTTWAAFVSGKDMR